MAIGKASDDFPRSDGIRRVPESSRSSFSADEDQLFKRKRNVMGKGGKLAAAAKLTRKKKVTTASKIAKTAAALNKPQHKVVIENMTLSRLSEGIVIYGCVQEINDFELRFSISGGIVVKVPITNISDSYTRLIEQFANGEANDTNEIELAKLSSIFQIGDYFPVKILSKQICDHFGHTEIIGSINPTDVMSNMTANGVRNLPDNFPVIAAVRSLEDYGYEMDIGVSGVKAFLPLEDLNKNFSEKKNTLQIGQLLACAFLRRDERSITLTTDKKLANFCLQETHRPSIYSFVPGIRTKCVISGVYSSGLELTLPGGEYKGFVPRYHIDENILTAPKQRFHIGDKVEGHVLYVQPHTKQVCISLKPKLGRKAVKNLLNSIKTGLVIEDALLCGVAEFGNVLFKLPSNCFGLALRKNLCEPQEYEALKLQSHFSTGSTHLCRVKKFHLFDNLIEISLRKSFIEQQELSVDDLHIGSIVQGTVKKLKKNGIYVRLGFGLNGFVPNMHLTDLPLSNFGKNREKLFSEKKKIKCRITRIDTSSRVPKISLTHKNTLLQLDESSLFIDFEDIKPGMSSTGVVCLTSEKGILLEFFGQVRAFIPVKYLATYNIAHPENVFSIGQLVKCTVVSVDPAANRMVCTLIDLDESEKLRLRTNSQLSDKKLRNDSLKVGQVLKRLTIIAKRKRGFDLTNAKRDIQVHLPMPHLSDDTFLSRLLFATMKMGDIVDETMVFSISSGNVVTVTRKRSFVDRAAEDVIVCAERHIQLDKPFPAVVRNITTNGVFFEIPNSLFGVIRRKNLQDGFYDDPQKLGLVRGQTIFVAAFDVTLFNAEKEAAQSETKSKISNLKRFKFSMKLSQVWNKEHTDRVRIMQSYLDDFGVAMRLIKSKATKEEEDDTTSPSTSTAAKTSNSDLEISFWTAAKKFATYSIGQVVTYVVTNITDDSIELRCSKSGNKHEPSVPGIAARHTDFGDLSIAQMGNAIVCDFDFDRKALRLFMQPSPAKILRQVRNANQKFELQSSPSRNVKIGQSIKGTVIYVGTRFVLASLAGHAPGLLAYVPSRRHRNDLGQIEKLFTIGSEYHFLIQHIDSRNGNVIAVLNVETGSRRLPMTKAKLPMVTLSESKSPAIQQQNQKQQLQGDNEDEHPSTSPVAKKVETKKMKKSLENEKTLDSKCETAESINKTEAMPKLLTASAKRSENKAAKRENGGTEFQWNIPDATPNLMKKRKHDELDTDNNNNNNRAEDDKDEDDEIDLDKLLDNDSSDDDDDDGDDTGVDGEKKKTKKRRNKTREERGAETREREHELRRKEIEMSDTGRTPKDEQDFEQAVIASPNSSLVWLKYMSFALESGDVAQARKIAERALERISFREEREKLNIWIGLLNLENTYGDQASMDALVARAIKYNDTKTIYLQLASIYANSGKREKAEQTYHVAVRKFRQDKSVWCDFFTFHMQAGRAESARRLFQRSLVSLEKRDHLDVISRFAQLEFRHGDAEQGKTIFESMLATYWKRLDQWSIYIDMLVKYTVDERNLDSIEFVRNIFERLITFKLPANKMKFVFKKYYDFETRFSAEHSDALDRIKQKALEYIESDIF